MQIESLEIQNFGPIELAHLDLAGKGLVNIEGVNKDDPSADSNGSGKSTIPDALYWCLFGETARDVSGDDVIANFAGKDCYVATSIMEGADKFLIARWRKKKGMGKTNGLSLARWDDAAKDWTDLTLGTDKLTQAKIEQVIGCSKEVFTKAVYSGQEALADLPKMTDKQIKELVEEAAGIQILTRAYELARDHMKACDREKQDAARNVMEGERRYNDAHAHLVDVDAKHTNFAGIKTARLVDAKDNLTGAELRLKALIATRDSFDLPAETAALDALRKRVHAVSEESDNLREFAETVSRTRVARAAAETALRSKLAEITRAKTHFEALDSQVGKPCGECGKAYAEEDLATVKTLAREKYEALRTEGVKLQADYSDAREKEAEAVRVHDGYKASMTDLSATLAEIAVKDKEIASYNELVGKIARCQDEVDRYSDAVASIDAETNPFVTMLADAKDKTNARLDELTSFRDALGAAEEKMEVAVIAVKTFGPTGVRAYVLDTVTPYLNDRTSHYLGTLSDGRIEAIWTTLAENSKGELVEKFCIEVKKMGGGSSFKALSGGEKRKVRLACTLALQDLVGSRASKPIDLWIGDEIDDALDEAGLERLMGVLQEKAREKGTVLVISHNSLSDYITETTTVTMEGGKSKVTGALC